ncbi:MAG: hypothetical protein R6X02_33350 [Enhygromyxa sp.]
MLLLIFSTGGCHRLADDFDFETLKVDACEQTCQTYDTCDPDRFVGMDPEDCFERCMTLLPTLDRANQCASRQIIALRCIGGLTCEEMVAHEEGNSMADYTAPCVAEMMHVASCAFNKPFDLEDVAPDPS